MKLMHPLYIIIALFCFIAPSTSVAEMLGPYSGTVLDATTGKPVDGASVLFYWRKRVPRLIESSSDLIEAKLVYTNTAGKYDLSMAFANTGIGGLDSTHVIIYAPGYRVYEKLIWNDTLYAKPDSDFRKSGNIVKLERIPPNFDHKAHYDQIEHALWGLEIDANDQEPITSWDGFVKSGLRTIFEKDQLLRRMEWEERRAGGGDRRRPLLRTGASGDKDPYLPQWLGLLRKGSSKEKQLALQNIRSLDAAVLDALKDKDAAVRAAAAAFLNRAGDRPKSDGSQADIAAALVAALQDREPAVRLEAAKALRYYADQTAVDALVKSLRDKDVWVRLEVVHALAGLGARHLVVGVGGRPPASAGVAAPATGPMHQTWGSMPQGAVQQGAAKPGSKPQGDAPGSKKQIGPEMFTTRKLVVNSPHLDLGNAIPPLIEVLDKDDDWREVFVQQEVVDAFMVMNVSDEKAIAALLRKAGGDYLKTRVMRALGQLGVLDAEETLLKALEDPDAGTRTAALNALRLLPISWEDRKKEDIIRACGDALKKPSAESRIYAVRVLGKRAPAEGRGLIIGALRDKDDEVAKAAVEELGKLDDKALLNNLLPFFSHGNASLRDAAVKAFQRIAAATGTGSVYAQRKGTGMIAGAEQSRDLPPGHRRLVNVDASGLLLAEAGRGDAVGTMSALSILGEYEDKRIEPRLILLLDDQSPEVQRRSSELLTLYGTERSVPALIKPLQASDKSLKHHAIYALELIGDSRAKKPLLELLKDDDESVRHDALKALKKYNDPAVTKAALNLIGTDKSDYARSQAVELMKDKRDPGAAEAMLKELDAYWGPAEFTTDEFRASGSLARLGEALKKYGLDNGRDTIEGINGLLVRVGLKEEALRSNPGQLPSKRIEVLEQRYRRSQRGADLRILNRAVLEEFHPHDCPKKYPDKTGRIPSSALSYLGEMGDRRAVGPILDILESEMEKGCGVDDIGKKQIVASLGKLNDQRPVQALIRILTCKNTWVPLKEETIQSLGALKAREALPALRAALQEDRIAGPAIRVLGEMQDPLALDDIKAKLYQNSDFRSEAVNAIIRINDERSAPLLAEFMMQHDSSLDDKRIFDYLQKVPREKSVGLFLKISGHLKRLDQRIGQILEILKQRGEQAMIRELARRTNDNDAGIRRGAVLLLGELREKECLAPVKAFLEDSDPGVRREARDSLDIIEARLSPNKPFSPGRGPAGDRPAPHTEVPPEALLWSAPLTLKAVSWANQPMAIDGANIILGGSIVSRNTGEADRNCDWRLERRSLTNGSLTPGFGDQGVATGDAVGRISGLVLDVKSLYLVGTDTRKDGHFLRIEKRRAEDGSLVAEFGVRGMVKMEPSGGPGYYDDFAIVTSGDTLLLAGSFRNNRYGRQGLVEKRRKGTGQLVPEFGDKGALMIAVYGISAIALDARYLYLAEKDFVGRGDSRWRIEKRSLDDGSLVPSFGLDGTVTTNPGPGIDEIRAMILDGGYLYLAGYDTVAESDTEWRIEKRNATDGSLVASFGKGGRIVLNPSAGVDWASAVAVDAPSGNYVYIVGKDQVPGYRKQQWRIELRKTSDGSLVPEFGMKGVMTYESGNGNGVALGILVSGGSLYVPGVCGEQAQLLKIRK